MNSEVESVTQNTNRQSTSSVTTVDDIKSILKFIISDTQYAPVVKFIQDSNLKHEDYIIYYYCLEFSKRNVSLTRQALLLALNANKMRWIADNSIYSKRFQYTVTREYISSMTNQALSTPQEFADVLVELVLKRYDDIMSDTNITLTEEQFSSSIEGYKIQASKDSVTKIIESILPLLSGESENIVYDHTRYYDNNILEAIRDMCTDKIIELNNSGLSNKGNDLLSSVGKESSMYDPIFHWNISNNSILSDPPAGFLITLTAPEKTGKTKFAIGEITYPALCEGKNVKYYSGEMSKSQILTSLIIKHIFVTQGITLDFKLVNTIIIMAQKIKNKTVSQTEFQVFKSFDKLIVELVLLAQRDLLNSSKFGKLTIVHAGDDASTGGIDSAQFIVENVEPTMMRELKAAKEEDRFDLVIVDHINHFRSSKSKSRNERLEDICQTFKRLATNVIHPMCAVLINHTKADDIKSADKSTKTSGSVNSLSLTGFGTSEMEKSADMALSLYSTPDQMKSGLVSMVVNADRWINHMELYQTNVFVLVSNRAANDFCLVGNTKTPYRGREE